MIASSRPVDRAGVLLMLLVCVSLGFNQIAAKIALTDIPPLIQAAARSAAGTLILGIAARWSEPQLYRRDATLWAGLAIGVVFAGEFILLYLGLQWTSASHAILFLYTAPFFVALGLKAFVPDERLGGQQWAGLILSFVGVAFALNSSSTAPGGMLVGDLFCLAAGALWGITTLMVKATNLRSAPPIKVLLYQLAVSAVVMALVAVIHGERWPLEVSDIALVSMAYQTFWIVCLTFLVWFWLLRRYRAGELSSFTFLTPLIGVCAGWLFLGDRIDTSFLFALSLVAGGILLVNWPVRKA